MASVKKPKKGILKTSSSFDAEHSQQRSKEMKWDEMNIIATHHPPDKDYGHMKIDEPPTPYSKYSDQEDEDEAGEGRRASIGKSDDMDPSSLSSKLENLEKRKMTRRVSTEDEEESSEEDEELTEEQLEHKKRFEQKRKLHYNEFQAIKLAKQLMEEEDEDDEDEGNSNKTEGKNDNDNTQSQDSIQMQTDENRNPEEPTKSQSYGTTGVTAVTQESSSGQKETLIN